jgi:hypothetical protein
MQKNKILVLMLLNLKPPVIYLNGIKYYLSIREIPEDIIHAT